MYKTRTPAKVTFRIHVENISLSHNSVPQRKRNVKHSFLWLTFVQQEV